MPDLLHRPVTEWDAFYSAVLERKGAEHLRRIKSRLYDKLDLLHTEIEELEEIKEEVFQAPNAPAEHGRIVSELEAQVEALVLQGQDVSLQIEVLTGLLGTEG